MSRESTNRGYYSEKRKRRKEKQEKRRAEPRIKHMKKNAVERAAESIINYMKERGYTEFPTIVTRSYNQRGDIYLSFRDHPETFYSFIVELRYDWPSKMLRDKIHEEVRTLVRKLREN
jgi:hypothetical protein